MNRQWTVKYDLGNMPYVTWLVWLPIEYFNPENESITFLIYHLCSAVIFIVNKKNFPIS